MSAITAEDLPGVHGHFGPYGGRFMCRNIEASVAGAETECFRAGTGQELINNWHGTVIGQTHRPNCHAVDSLQA
ncbi:MAG TPA: hypothetical protein VMV89_12975 [Candidatus Paceibacterota bacterium]|nr:hypothetical protein [Candidatus Paceibacterota bacterium]